MTLMTEALLSEWHDSLTALLGEQVRFYEPMHRHTTLKVGGPAECYVSLKDEARIPELLRFVEKHQLPFTILGGGSNCIVADDGIAGVVLNAQSLDDKITQTKQADGHELWSVGAAVTTIGLVRKAVDAGLKGAEVLAGVPGTIGGAVIMNAGGHDGELKDHTRRVRIADKGGVRWIPASEAGFSYRSSRFPTRTVILGIEIELVPTPREELSEYVKQHMQRRKATQPLEWANAGSFFKNPPGNFAGRLIEECKLKGKRIGCAEVSTLHANFLIKAKDKSSDHPSEDFVKLVDFVRQQVWMQHRIWLELEVRPIGEFSDEERRVLGQKSPEEQVV